MAYSDQLLKWQKEKDGHPLGMKTPFSQRRRALYHVVAPSHLLLSFLYCEKWMVVWKAAFLLCQQTARKKDTLVTIFPLFSCIYKRAAGQQRFRSQRNKGHGCGHQRKMKYQEYSLMKCCEAAEVVVLVLPSWANPEKERIKAVVRRTQKKISHYEDLWMWGKTENEKERDDEKGERKRDVDGHNKVFPLRPLASGVVHGDGVVSLS